MKTLSEYYQYTGAAREQRDYNTLRGMLSAMKCDATLSFDEVRELANWCSLHEALLRLEPFSEIMPMLENALADGRIDDAETAEIAETLRRVTCFCEYYDDITYSLQYLGGFVHGLIADRELADQEIFALREWLMGNEFLSGSYPFDELYSLVVSVCADGTITEDERGTILAFIGDLVDLRESCNLSAPDFTELKAKYTVPGVCALCPEIRFRGKSFVLTGESSRASRSEIAEKIKALGGEVRNGVSGNTDYLVVGNEGNPCWAFACYGRKIETAVRLRKSGAKLMIVNENDFWDAVFDAAAGLVE